MQSPSADPNPMLDAALGEIDRLEATIGTLLSVARDQPISRDPVDLDRMLAAVTRRWSAVLDERDRSLACASSIEGHPRVSRNVLEQILDILLSNALQHGRGDVTIDASEEGNNVVITVSDLGRIGRDPSELFTRRDPGASGHGLGLALARSLAESEGGRLVLAATDPTTFRLLLMDHAGKLSDANGTR